MPQVFNSQKQAEHEARMSEALVAHWTDILSKAAELVTPGKRPCDWHPWTEALSRAQGQSAEEARVTHRYDPRLYRNDLMVFAEYATRARWDPSRHDLIEFALLFMEADVMLLRSGRAKRNFARRLRQASLEPGDIARLEAILKRAVTDGTGLDEFREYARLFATLACRGEFPDLCDWMVEHANGAILRSDELEWDQIWNNPNLSERDKRRLIGLFHAFGLRWPALDTVLPAGFKVRSTPDQMIRRNAFRMLRAWVRRCPEAARDRTGITM